MGYSRMKFGSPRWLAQRGRYKAPGRPLKWSPAERRRVVAAQRAMKTPAVAMRRQQALRNKWAAARSEDIKRGRIRDFGALSAGMSTGRGRSADKAVKKAVDAEKTKSAAQLKALLAEADCGSALWRK